ncbi:MAG: hypothetical protein WC932_02345 [archaeon]
MRYTYIWKCNSCGSLRECIFKTHKIDDLPHMCAMGIIIPPYELVTTI